MSERIVRYRLPDGTTFEVKHPFYLGSCDHCGHIGSTEKALVYHNRDDADVGCPNCGETGYDCGTAASTAKKLSS